MTEKRFKDILIFLSTDKYPSPFDIQLVYDIGFDHVITYGEVTSDNCKQLILDAMFPRGPEGVLHTVMFIGGMDVDKVVKIADIAKKTMFPPFQIATVVDPQGGYTTAAALASKVASCLKKSYDIDYKKAKYAIIGGAGRVGSNAAYLLAKDGGKVRIIDILLDQAKERMKEINSKIGAERVEVIEPPPKSDQDYINVLKGFDVIITTGPPRLQLISQNVLGGIDSCKVIADINATPPTGIEGIKMGKDCKQYKYNEKIYSVGPLAVGTFKNEVEAALIKKALESPAGKRGFYELDEAYEVAKEILNL